MPPKPERSGTAPRRAVKRRPTPPIEHRILVTATLCLLAFGSVMVYSASSPVSVLADGGGGTGTGDFLMYLLSATVGLLVMQFLSRRGLQLITPKLTGMLLVGSMGLLLAVLVPGIGHSVQGARRWLGAGPVQFQPSELVKLALILHVSRYLADNPRRLERGAKDALAPILAVLAPACGLIALEPDLGTAIVVAFTVTAVLVAAGLELRHLALLAALAALVVFVFVLARPYERARLTSFLNPWSASARQAGGYQAVQGQIAVGSGGLFGRGLGQGIQKIFYIPEPQTDFILAVVGEELGVLGIAALVALYGMIAYAGLRTARQAASRYAKLLATGLTSLILCQGLLNIFVVLGLAPLTGVPLPFISYAPSNLLIMLASVGLLLNIASPAVSLRLVDSPARESTAHRDRGRRNGGPRRAGAGGRGRATG